MKKKFKIALSLVFVAGMMLVSGCGCRNNAQSYKINLEVWGFLDDSDAFATVFDNYKKVNKNIGSITYRKLSTDTYKKELIEALASGQGPDVFLVNNTWLSNFQNKIVPAPKDIFPEQKFRDSFVDVAASDFDADGSVWAAPLSVDSLGLYYNKDLFNMAGITSTPRNWNEFMEDVKLLTKVDSDGEITQSGAAMGTAYNINRSTDVLSMLMIQNGTMMSGEKMNATFNTDSGKNALTFYTQFAKTSSPSYSWNPRMHYSIDAFSEGKTAMMFNYSWHIPTIRSKSPKLNFAVAKIPQFSENSPINYANYWAYAVAKNKTILTPGTGVNSAPTPGISNDTRIKESWKFISYLTTKPDAQTQAAATSAGSTSVFDPAMDYIQKKGVPAARKDIIEIQKTDPDLGAFATGNLIAKSWREVDPESIESILADMIDQINKGSAGIDDAISSAAARINKIGVN